MTDDKKPGYLPRAIDAKWSEAALNPGVAIDVGDIVVCDYCDLDYRHRPECGGFIFQSKAICPKCAPESMASIKRYGEQKYIRAECPPGVSFWQFVLDYRKACGSNSITINFKERL